MSSVDTYKSFEAIKDAPIRTLRKFVRSTLAEEQCELCSARVQAEHRHLLDMEKRTIVCTCDACALRFHNVVEGRLKLIPRDVYSLTDVAFTDQQWENLALPIDLAFLYNDSRAGKIVAMYPSPAGAMESLLSVDMWKTCAGNNPALESLADDVEALVVNRVKGERKQYIVPLDVCYELVGIIRTHWRGLSGGDVVWGEIAKYFERLERRAKPYSAEFRGLDA